LAVATSGSGETLAGFEHLLLGFGRAGARNEEGLVFGLAVEKVVEHGGVGLIK
jgi:hypothetical protein